MKQTSEGGFERGGGVNGLWALSAGSIALSPDFSNGEGEGEKYRIERRDGSVYEYSIINHSKREETPLAGVDFESLPPPRVVGQLKTWWKMCFSASVATDDPSEV